MRERDVPGPDRVPVALRAGRVRRGDAPTSTRQSPVRAHARDSECASDGRRSAKFLGRDGAGAEVERGRGPGGGARARPHPRAGHVVSVQAGGDAGRCRPAGRAPARLLGSSLELHQLRQRGPDAASTQREYLHF